MTHKKYITTLKVITIMLMILTPVFVALDAHRLGYIPMNGAWFTWAIPAVLLMESEVE